MSAEKAFPQSPAGRPEIKVLPAGMLLKSAAKGDYFESANGLFRPLFKYISKNDIAMTTPVEAQVGGPQAAMYFWVAQSERGKVRGGDGGVEVVELQERRVASLGARGGYSRENFETTRGELERWLAGRGEWEAAGPAYAVYWNGPFTPAFLKRYEVHVPVRARGGEAPRS